MDVGRLHWWSVILFINQLRLTLVVVNIVFFYIFLERTLAASTVSTFPVEIIICHKKMSLHDGKPNITHIGNIWTEKKHASLFLSLNYYFCVDIYPFQVYKLYLLLMDNAQVSPRWSSWYFSTSGFSPGFILLSFYFYF